MTRPDLAVTAPRCVHAEAWFDGRTWHGPVSIEVVDGRIAHVGAPRKGRTDVLSAASLVPGCTDWGVSAHGYNESLAADPFAPERAFARLSLAWGITEIVDVSNGPGPLEALRHLAGGDNGPTVRFGGSRLTSRPTARVDVLVEQACGGMRRRLAGERAAGADLVSVGRLDSEVRAVVDRYARENDLMVAEPLMGQGRPGLRFSRGSQVLVAPQLALLERWTVDGLAGADDAALAEDFLPYARHFKAPRGRVGRGFAKAALRDLYGDRPPVDANAAVNHVTDAGVDPVASSAGGWAAMVPGRSLWRDVALLGQRVGTDRALAAACRTFDDADRIAVGRRAAFVLTEVGGPSATLTEIADSMTHVVLGRRLHDVAALRPSLT